MLSKRIPADDMVEEGMSLTLRSTQRRLSKKTVTSAWSVMHRIVVNTDGSCLNQGKAAHRRAGWGGPPLQGEALMDEV